MWIMVLNCTLTQSLIFSILLIGELQGLQTAKAMESQMATARAQAAVGAGGTGAMAEKPELFTNILILFAIPETIVILGFVIAFLLLNKI